MAATTEEDVNGGHRPPLQERQAELIDKLRMTDLKLEAFDFAQDDSRGS